ncbi:PQQ-binding-like beta-propeller repeat protein [Sulfitobacter donghicola]|uniref:Quinoprotein n=1 Tax=Sulfitobacter donghicola DSW-25 = KCTC 12864 = JCM 14565 TaxID=1300350 RepID=A0A073IIF0_9RHOB|nr:PQQ-binding-like beta-propeller repeat protein [Sulfitobacter donghicola]KEJ90098.1 quinoprotein [Sulfitobacter donghicola DSW-25 = KCTC 12864 = JCM 14565]KIN66750.1 PQQ enzyme repeat family protein [Sulfitobacter donghicola DSW-25 = KCTC 12864 = JCM 14565]
MTDFSYSLQRKRPSGLRALMFGMVGVSVMVSGCTEPDTVLPGYREDVRSVLQNQSDDLGAAATFEGNQKRSISLPAARANKNWAQTTGNASTRVSHPALGGSLSLAWAADIGEGDSRKHRITAVPVVSNGRIFTLDAQSVVTATSTSGAPLWQVDLRPARDQAGDASGGGLVVAGDSVYVSVGVGVLAALDVANGSTRWTQQLDASGSGTPTVSGDLVYVTAGDNTGWAVDRHKGTVEWQIGASGDTSNILGAPAPALTEDLAIFAFGSGEVQAVFRRGGLSRWDASILGKRSGRALSNISDVTSAPVVSGGHVYVGNQSGRIAALDVNSGARVWTARDGAIGPVWPVGGSIFALNDLNELIRLDANDGSKIWSAPLPNFVKRKPLKQSRVVAHHGPIVAGGRVIVASGDGQLRSFDPTNGAQVTSVEIPGGATSAPVVAGRTLYVVSADGKLLAYR